MVPAKDDNEVAVPQLVAVPPYWEEAKVIARKLSSPSGRLDLSSATANAGAFNMGG